eukprot:CAMPEP_0195016482 /NCGR_PEP_ID=MMETSP0326_2-20130528/24513_1 /TAXON_ID=2866 ORGANISM="Crypthecodinium cohnii, Strain Seligo" /NCGR_SAMPLE_ID=MMETSP0326_2 /ASSEMBLY_ACC=CAM_ASM_000348 /LENGTH=65 /DNA_ID=CAMNT_0040032167 /DNA_START=55 /DNA_END=252 /DNA_ORIENTATION=+
MSKGNTDDARVFPTWSRTAALLNSNAIEEGELAPTWKSKVMNSLTSCLVLREGWSEELTELGGQA